mgnify:CR=1 FL=1
MGILILFLYFLVELIQSVLIFLHYLVNHQLYNYKQFGGHSDCCQYYKEMYYYACCVTGSEELAQDAVSEAVLAAFRQIGSLKKAEAFKEIYAEYILKLSEMVHCPIDELAPVIYLLISIVTDYVVWEDREATDMQMSHLYKLFVRMIAEA